jgi:hypothetical protein
LIFNKLFTSLFRMKLSTIAASLALVSFVAAAPGGYDHGKEYK